MKFLDRIRQSLRPSIPVEIFTRNTQISVALARRAAAQCKHPDVDTEHLLVGILWLEACSAFSLLESAGTQKRALLELLTKRLTADSSELPFSELPYSDAVKKVLALSSREAHAIGCDHVGTDHMVLGLLKYESGLAYRVLSEAGLSYSNLKCSAQRLEEAKPKNQPDAATSANPVVKSEATPPPGPTDV